MAWIKVDTATSGDNQIVAAVSQKIIRVTNFFLVSAGAVVVYFKGSAQLFGAMSMITGTPLAPGFPPSKGQIAGMQDSLFDVPAGQALVLNLSGNIQVSGFVNYQIVGVGAST